jgi:hypothetical protein
MSQQQIYDCGAKQNYSTQTQILNLRLHGILRKVNILGLIILCMT